MIESRLGYILISTTQGFSMLDVENNKIHNYGIENGLPLNSLFNGGMCQTIKGELFMAGMNGMVSFYEENLSIPHRSFNLNLVNLHINNKLVVPGDENNVLEATLPYTKTIELNHRQTMLTIEFAANNYIPANQPVYRYRLEGSSDAWTELPQGITKLNFMNLGAGKYKLVVEAISPADGKLIASTDLNIQVFPPFYFAWYAYLFYLMLIVFIVWRYVGFSRSRLLLQTSLTYEKKEKEHLEEVNQSKLRFFTNISHEFRTPLTLIVGQVDMLLQTHNIQPSIYNRILNVKRNTLNMQNLINELLEFRKTEQGHLHIKVSESDLVKFLYEIYLPFSEYANYRQIKFNFECQEPEIMLWFDQVQLQKVFYNLISNAFKYTPKDGTIRIIVEQDAHTASVKIMDSGIGITTDAIGRIFDRFYQAENGLQISNMVPGTGIGLALTKNILETHSAEIIVDSQPNVGSCFTVILKKGSSHFSEEQKTEFEDVDESCMRQMKEIDTEFIQELISAQVVDNEPLNSMLIVEDNDELRTMLQSIFEPIYKIFTAVDGQEGLAMTIEHQPDIVLSDVMMPNMSGSEMCSKIKHNFAVCHIPVVLLTAQTAIEFNIEGLRLGADDYITKPFNVKTLITRCNNLVNGRKLLQEKFSKQTDFTPRLIATNNLDREFLEKAQEIIEKNIENADFDVPFFSREMALGRTKLFSKIKGITGQTPNDFIITVKMKKAASLLTNNPEFNISDITYMLGFSTPKYFAKCFKEQFGVSPSTFRKGDETEDEMDEGEIES
jgi:signal transduction histidine kinase/DNA-binding response OmpR family regulator